MNKRLTDLLERVRHEYIHEMESNGLTYPYLTAYRVAHRSLTLTGDQLAELVASDPTLLAARAGELIDDPREVANPSLGAIVTANLVSAAMEGLMLVAANREWIELNEQGEVQIEAHEYDLIRPVSGVDYAESGSKAFVARRGQTLLSRLYNTAELSFESSLEASPQDAYQLVLKTAADHAIFAPDDLAPLIVENPLLLGLRNDQVIDQEMFDGDPPAGMILSAHLTEMLVQQLIDRAIELGALGRDVEGQPLFDYQGPEDPTVH